MALPGHRRPGRPLRDTNEDRAGWNTYDALVAPGDIDLDGKADLIARQPNGDLCFYKGTGDAAAPFEAKRNIGSGYQTYRVLFS
ncbi:hypothetical protein [Streptomyces sp. 2114.4]|uniref:hypothetical protein n=1 Tax=Streptomyces sp. 2114.4 TaxID=1938836 RepID=UPI000B58DB67|nr:hypothetical protein [Streptomyces sp. 2114.4]